MSPRVFLRFNKWIEKTKSLTVSKLVMPNEESRARTRAYAIKMICEKYERVYEMKSTFHSSPRDVSKYVKHTPDEVRGILTELFRGTR